MVNFRIATIDKITITVIDVFTAISMAAFSQVTIAIVGRYITVKGFIQIECFETGCKMINGVKSSSIIDSLLFYIILSQIPFAINPYI